MFQAHKYNCKHSNCPNFSQLLYHPFWVGSVVTSILVAATAVADDPFVYPCLAKVLGKQVRHHLWGKGGGEKHRCHKRHLKLNRLKMGLICPSDVKSSGSTNLNMYHETFCEFAHSEHAEKRYISFIYICISMQDILWLCDMWISPSLVTIRLFRRFGSFLKKILLQFHRGDKQRFTTHRGPTWDFTGVGQASPEVSNNWKKRKKQMWNVFENEPFHLQRDPAISAWFSSIGVWLWEQRRIIHRVINAQWRPNLGSLHETTRIRIVIIIIRIKIGLGGLLPLARRSWWS